VRSQLTLDDVDFTVLIATSVLQDLIDKCPPAEACRDAFLRMSKATISMVLNSTGFGNLSTLGSQPLNSPGGYFSGRTTQQTSPGTTQMSSSGTFEKGGGLGMEGMPQFDFNLRDLFSEEEIANRPLTTRQQLQTQGFVLPQQAQQQGHQQSYTVPMVTSPTVKMESGGMHGGNPSLQSSGGAMSQDSPSLQQTAGAYQSQGQGQGQGRQQMSNQPPVDEPMAQPSASASQQAGFAGLEDLGFLDSFPGVDPNQYWSTSTNSNLGNFGDLDLGFGTGGAGGGFDANGAWEANGGVDLFDGFFFGGNNNAGGGF
jgi:hypothetical protein